MKAAMFGLLLAIGSGCAANTAQVAKNAQEMDAIALEERCMLVAELAYEAAAGHAMSSLGDAPVPDAAYEDAYAACTEGR